MKVLIVTSYKESLSGHILPYVKEQVDALNRNGVDTFYFLIKGHGFIGYLQNLKRLKQALKDLDIDVIHAHYGLSGLLANLQRDVPVVTTYHGSDVNKKSIRILSKICAKLSAFNIFVSQKGSDLIPGADKRAIIPCGINLEDYPDVEKAEARNLMSLKPDVRYVLFAGAFDNHVKNAPLAKKAISMVPNTELLELKGYSRQQVNLLLHAVDAFLMTSFTEGSPQVIKEALACGCPIVSVDVGDVKDNISSIKGCYMVERTVASIAGSIKSALACIGRTEGRKVIEDKGFDNNLIANRLISIYKSVLNK